MHGRKKWNVSLVSHEAAALTVLSVCFLIGSVSGCMVAGSVCASGGTALLDYVREYMSLFADGGGQPDLGAVLWETVRFPLAAFLLGFTVLGVLGLPVLFLIRGFLLCYAVSAFYLLFGIPGELPAFFLFGLSAVIWLPVFCHLGVRGMLASYGLLRRTAGDGRRLLRYDSRFWACSGVCAVALLMSAALEFLVVPELIRMIAVSF